MAGIFNLITSPTIQLTVNNVFSINYTDDWIRTADLWKCEATTLPTEPQPLPLDNKYSLLYSQLHKYVGTLPLIQLPASFPRNFVFKEQCIG